MVQVRTSVVSARVDAELAAQIERLAQAEGVTPSRFLESVIRKAVVEMEHRGPSGSAKLRLVDEANTRHGSVRFPDHPGVSIWELEADVWPRHFLHVRAEYGLTPDEGSTEMWLLWRGEGVEKIDPDAYLKRLRSRGASQRNTMKKGR